MSGIDQATKDVTQAKAMGFDAFALNVISTDQWSMATIALLFQAAAAIGKPFSLKPAVNAGIEGRDSWICLMMSDWSCGFRNGRVLNDA